MDNNELKDLLLALTDSVLAITHTAYYGHEMAWGCHQMLVERSPDPLKADAEYRKGLYGAGKLTLERDELIAKLHELRQKLTSL